MSFDLDEVRAGQWAQAEACRRALAEVARVVDSAGGALVAIKGLHLAFCVATFPGYRPMADGDAVLVGGDFDRVRRALAARWRVRTDDWSSVSVSLGRSCTIDLHRRPLPAFFGRLDAQALARRARRADLFGPSVSVPDLDDAAVVAIAHFAKDKVGAFGHGLLGVDLQLLLQTGEVSAESIAARLEEHGLRRAGLIAFAALAARGEDVRALADACRPSTAERRWAATFAQHMAVASPGRRTLGFVLTRAIGDDPSAIARNMLLGTAMRVPFLVRDALERRS